MNWYSRVPGEAEEGAQFPYRGWSGYLGDSGELGWRGLKASAIYQHAKKQN